MNVSIIIPAYNAAETIAETVQSVLGQTFSDWEAIIVDDGSTDGTAAIGQGFAEQVARIRCVSQPRSGVSAARNTGTGLARYDWLLFLDADDLLLPFHLKRLTDALASDPGLDAAYCGWARLTPDGRQTSETCFYQAGDLFHTFARYSLFPIHACIVRRSLVQQVGGWDESLRTCEEWDLWQRIARTGANYGVLREVLALYRMSHNSLSVNGVQMFSDGLRVLLQGHSPDPRVPNALPAHTNGLPRQELLSQKFYFLCWCAALEIGNGCDARPLLALLKDHTCPQLDPHRVALAIFRAAVLPLCRDTDAWVELPSGGSQRIDEFLLALEEQCGAPGLARCTKGALERLNLEKSNLTRPINMGTTYAVQVEITVPIPDIFPPQSIERLHCAVTIEGDPIGTLELPVCGGFIPAYVIADAISAELGWSILGRFFERTVYPNLGGGTPDLAEKACGFDRDVRDEFHNRLGWRVFLKEIWESGTKNVPVIERLRDKIGLSRSVRVMDGWFTLEVSKTIPSLKVCGKELNVVVTVGGVAIGVMTVPVTQNIVRAQELRAALTSKSGYELCVAAVREGLIGRPIAEQGTLRERLGRAASETAKVSGSLGTPGACRFLEGVLSSGERIAVLGRRRADMANTSVSRRAMLPASVATELIDSAEVSGDPVIKSYRSDKPPTHVVYAPDVIFPTVIGKAGLASGENKIETARVTDERFHGRSYFESLFAKQPDPWRYTSPYEQTKYEQTISLIPRCHITRALELACAEGHFTMQIAPLVGRLIASDISRLALDRATERCSGLTNVRFELLDLVRDPLPGRFELIVCSEVLYFVGNRDVLNAVARKIAEAIEQGGYLLIAHANLVVDEPDRTGFDWDLPFGAKVIGETFAGIPSLCLVKELLTPLYRVQLFQRNALSPSGTKVVPEVIELDRQPTPLLPEVAARVLWNGGLPKRVDATHAVVTERLPILMYHRVAPVGSSSTVRYRVTPEAFEEQLRYLRDAGYYSVRLEDWRRALAAKRPLPGRAVLMTFDDGYFDFLTYAWPLLRRYNFSAMVFIVSDLIGQSNSWDRMYGEEVPLLRWNEILQLQGEGVEFGSHANSHRPLTALSIDEVVREGAKSRAILERGLGRPVTALAYPYGSEDRVIQHLVGACGYIFGLSCRPARSGLHDSLLALPRIEVAGSDKLGDFVAKLAS